MIGRGVIGGHQVNGGGREDCSREGTSEGKVSKEIKRGKEI